MYAEARGGLTHGRIGLALHLAPLQPAVLVVHLQLEAQRARDAPIAIVQATLACSFAVQRGAIITSAATELGQRLIRPW